MNKVAIDELKGIVRQHPIWFLLGMQDIKLRYRRSTLGPFWITLSTAVTIFAMGYLYGHLFKVASLDTYFPYLATGMIAWTLISSLLNESVNVFLEAEGFIRNSEVIFSTFVVRMVLRNLIIFAHNLLVFIPIIFIYHVHLSYTVIGLIPGLFIISLNGVFWGTILGVLGTRFRDLLPIIGSIVQVIFFVSPIMWMTSLLPGRLKVFVDFNPIYQMLNLVRAPLLNEPLTILSYGVIFIVTFIGFCLYSLLIRKYKYNIVFWL